APLAAQECWSLSGVLPGGYNRGCWHPRPHEEKDMRCTVLTLAALLGVAVVALAPAADQKKGEAIALFNGKDLTGWKTLVDARDKGKTKPEQIWSVKDETIICNGRPYGYIITEKEYGDYVLELEWRWAAKPGNSGVLCHVTGPDKIWPKCF